MIEVNPEDKDSPVGEKMDVIPKKIILISVDTLRADHLGCYGYKKNTSPAIDLLASSSLLFRHAFSAAPFTIPSHASMLTGKYPSHHSLGFNQRDGQLDTDSDVTLAEMLRANNYATAGFVSCMVLRSDTHLNSGFDVYDDDQPSHELNRPDVLTRKGAETIKKSIAWIQENRDNNFFLFIHLFDTHGAYSCPEEYLDIFLGDPDYYQGCHVRPSYTNWAENPQTSVIPHHQLILREKSPDCTQYETDAGYYIARYDACVRYVNDTLYTFFMQLKELGIFDDCLIILTSDHGESFGENDIYFCHGLTVSREQIHIPLIIKPHKGWAEPQEIDIHVSSIDLMPTILDLCNIRLSGTDGASLKRLVECKSDPDLENRILLSENERQVAQIFPDGSLVLHRKDTIPSSYYGSIPEVIEKLDGIHENWKRTS